VFPELSAGLGTLNHAIELAANASDIATFAVALSSVYEAGRTLIAALDRIAAHPLGTMEDSLDIDVQQTSGTVFNNISGMWEAFGQLESQAWVEGLPNTLLDWLLPGARESPAPYFDDIFPLSDAAGLDQLADVAPPIISTKDLQDLLRDTVFKGGTGFEERLRTQIQLKIKTTLDAIGQAASSPPAPLASYVNQLLELQTELSVAGNALTLQQIAAHADAIAYLSAVAGYSGSLLAALSPTRPEKGLPAAFELAELLLGPLPDTDPAALARFKTLANKFLGQALVGARQVLQTLLPDPPNDLPKLLQSLQDHAQRLADLAVSARDTIQRDQGANAQPYAEHATNLADSLQQMVRRSATLNASLRGDYDTVKVAIAAIPEAPVDIFAGNTSWLTPARQTVTTAFLLCKRLSGAIPGIVQSANDAGAALQWLYANDYLIDGMSNLDNWIKSRLTDDAAVAVSFQAVAAAALRPTDAAVKAALALSAVLTEFSSTPAPFQPSHPVAIGFVQLGLRSGARTRRASPIYLR
jgi:hypothetical protein